MSCLATTGFELNCGKPTGGLKEILIANWSDVKGQITFDTNGVISAMPTVSLYRWELDPQSASFTCTPNANVDNQTAYWTHTVTMKRRGITYQVINEVQRIFQGRVVIFARDEQDQIWMLGYERGLDVTGGGGFASGTAMSDMNGLDLVFTGQSRTPLVLTKPYTTTPFDTLTSVTVDPAY